MNKRGFTLVEIIVVISLLGLVLIITSTNILSGSNKAKNKMLETKKQNILKAAVLYGQENREKINVTDTGNEALNNLCYNKSNIRINNCYFFKDENKTTITVGKLAVEGYINYDEEDGTNNIINPVDNKPMNDDEIQIYQKYGKIYAKYIETTQ